MFSELVVLGIRTGTIYRVGLPDGQVTPLYKDSKRLTGWRCRRRWHCLLDHHGHAFARPVGAG